jgi:hypothetical protein
MFLMNVGMKITAKAWNLICESIPSQYGVPVPCCNPRVIEERRLSHPGFVTKLRLIIFLQDSQNNYNITVV